jgi:glucose-1-phosphate adenylyltransferase
MENVLTVILAGGKGSRLEPLTRDRAKPAVPFGGAYRIIDFALSNCLNSGLRHVLVLTQYKAMSLERHINLGWRRFFVWELGDFLDVLPPQQRINEHWYRGTADAVYQNIYAIEKRDPKLVLVLAGDHVYKMDYSKMIQFHRESRADVTVAALPVAVEKAASQFGVMEVDGHSQIVGFEEKPASPREIPGQAGQCLASMGIYIFNARSMYEQLCRNAAQVNGGHDFGHNILPASIHACRVFAFPFRDENHKAEAYWRDVGTLDSYYAANMDLVTVDPQLNVYDQSWPIHTHLPNLPPPKFVFADSDAAGRCGHALDSIVCAGSILSGGRVERSIVGPMCRINSYATVEDSILFEGVHVGRRSRIRRAIIEKGVQSPANFQIGFDREEDLERGFTMSDDGIVVIPRTTALDRIVAHPHVASP